MLVIDGIDETKYQEAAGKIEAWIFFGQNWSPF